MNDPLVSIIMITYNHEKYIQQAICSVLMQEYKFSMELIIADDHSSDGTEDKVREVIRNHPKGNIISYTKHPINKGMQPNFVWAYEQCKGKYIAICEGDDYWTDPLKLQKQVDFLENNPRFIMVSHKVGELQGDITSNYDWRWDKKKVMFSLEDYIYKIFFHTSSVLFRKIPLPDYLASKQILHGDVAVFSFILTKGEGYYFENSMSVYRKHSDGISNSSLHKDISRHLQSKYYLYDNLNTITKGKYEKFINCKKKIENQIYLMYTTPYFTFYRIRYWGLKLYYRFLLLF